MKTICKAWDHVWDLEDPPSVNDCPRMTQCPVICEDCAAPIRWIEKTVCLLCKAERKVGYWPRLPQSIT